MRKSVEALVENLTSVGAARYIIGPRNVFGTPANKVRLTGRFATSSCFNVVDMDKLVVAGTYTPGTANAYVSLWVSATTVKEPTPSSSIYFPLPARVAGTTEIDVYADGGTGGGGAITSSSTGAGQSGLPWIFPGDKTSTVGVSVTSTVIELDTFSYTGVCIEPVESVTTGNGTLWLEFSGKAGQ